MKVLLVQAEIPHYRIPIFNCIAAKHDFTVAYFVKTQTDGSEKFKVIQIPVKKYKSLYFHSFFMLLRLYRSYDVVISGADLHYPILNLLFFFPRKRYYLGAFTIGIRSSYTRPFCINRKHTFLDWIHKRILIAGDFFIFYMRESFKFWHNTLPREKFFVAHNTVQVLPMTKDERNIKKTSILFVGTLYEEKKVFELLNAFIHVKKRNNVFFHLDIVGNGPEFDRIKQIIQDNHMEDSITLYGAIYDECKLKSLFMHSALCVSPAQAGLSVLKSFGYGVPFVTRTNAITGGERLNIQNGFNGYLYQSEKELEEILLSTWENPHDNEIMAENAYHYYYSQATPEKMANGFLEAIDYVTQ